MKFNQNILVQNNFYSSAKKDNAHFRHQFPRTRIYRCKLNLLRLTFKTTNKQLNIMKSFKEHTI